MFIKETRIRHRIIFTIIMVKKILCLILVHLNGKMQIKRKGRQRLGKNVKILWMIEISIKETK
jgi:hypothetical protein